MFYIKKCAYFFSLRLVDNNSGRFLSKHDFRLPDNNNSRGYLWKIPFQYVFVWTLADRDYYQGYNKYSVCQSS